MIGRDEWLRTEQHRGVSRADVYAHPERYDLPAFACNHAAPYYAGAMCAGCKTMRQRIMSATHEQ